MTMNHAAIIEWATEHGLTVHDTEQGHPHSEMWPVTLITGAMPDPDAMTAARFGPHDRHHIPIDGQIVYGFDDDHAIAVLIDADHDGKTDAWLHLMLYADAATYTRGWASQTPTPDVG